MAAKNLMLVISSLSGGGAELVVENLCRHIDRNLFNVTVCHLRGRGERGDDLLEEGYEVIGVSPSHSGKTDYFRFLKLKNLIEERNIEIIHSHSTESLVESGLSRLMISELRHVHTFHYGNYPNLNRKDLWLEKLCWRMPNRLVAVGYEQRRAIIRTFGIPDNRIVTILNGICPFRIDPVYRNGSATKKEDNRLVIGSLSTFIPQKGLDYLLEAVFLLRQKRRDFVLDLVGDGPLRDHLKRKCSELKIDDCVRFHGWVKNASQTVLPIFDIFVQSSLWEGMSMVILEAMAAGKAIVATSVGENKHVLSQAHAGFLVESKDVSSMAERIESLMDDENLRSRMGNNARDLFIKNYTVDQMVRRYETLYLEISGKKAD